MKGCWRDEKRQKLIDTWIGGRIAAGSEWREW
jgi:hypothetical protein